MAMPLSWPPSVGRQLRLRQASERQLRVFRRLNHLGRFEPYRSQTGGI